MDISEEIDKSRLAFWGVNELYLTWTIGLIILNMFLMFEYILKPFGSDKFL